ncbi:hypothetical protein R9208_06615 [Flammeovirgaceae bacterium SG7u.132]|nr:hypothetical protein [Flammeovirgaceae bacterium SG7u.132]
MRKEFVKYLLLLWILVLSGLSQLTANTISKNTLSTPKGPLSELEDTYVVSDQNERDFLIHLTEPHKETDLILEETEIEEKEEEREEDEKYDSHKKNFDNGFFTISYTQTPPYFFHYTKNSLLLDKHSLYTPHHRLYLAFQVLRI